MYKCSDYAPGLNNTFSLDVTCDNPHVHPCHPCKNIVYITSKAVEKGTKYNPGITVHTCGKHKESGYLVCGQSSVIETKYKKNI